MGSIQYISINLQMLFRYFFGSKDHKNKQSKYSEAHQTCSSHRSNKLNILSDTLASDLTKKEHYLIKSHDENYSLKRKLEAVTQ